MKPEIDGGPVFDRAAFLATYFENDFSDPIPVLHELITATAKWRVGALPGKSRVLIAVRTAQTGDIDSFSIDLDSPDKFEHVFVDGHSSFTDDQTNVQAQEIMGLTAPNEDEVAIFDELVDELRLIASIS